jgi:methylated-DNA-[protein]-cysteine S-methyltransferase
MPLMPHLTLHSPVGELTVFEADGEIVALEWGRAGEGGKPSALLKDAKRQLDDYFSRKRKTFDLPLTPAGTDFQRAVWDAMCRIRYGETASYADLARETSSGPRAVGTACGKNPLPIFIPCHRVLASNGIGGYSGGQGLPTKRALLRLEGNLLI